MRERKYPEAAGKKNLKERKRSKLDVARTLDMARIVCAEAKEQMKREGLPRDRECPEMLDNQQG